MRESATNELCKDARHCKGQRRRTKVRASTSAPRSSSSPAVDSWPLKAAAMTAVQPSCSRITQQRPRTATPVAIMAASPPHALHPHTAPCDTHAPAIQHNAQHRHTTRLRPPAPDLLTAAGHAPAAAPHTPPSATAATLAPARQTATRTAAHRTTTCAPNARPRPRPATRARHRP